MTGPATGSGAVAVGDRRLRPDASRVIARLFTPGQEFSGVEDPARTGVAQRMLTLSDGEAARHLAEIIDRFGDRHDGLEETFLDHGRMIADRLAEDRPLTIDRLMLLGAAFTTELSIEGAALCNPSIVAHPDQTGVAPDALRVVMSVRAISEGHRSSIGFRTGTVDSAGGVTIDRPAPKPVAAAVRPGPYDRATFHMHLRELGQDGESAASVLDALGSSFTFDQLEPQLHRLRTRHDNPIAAYHAADRLRSFADRSYTAAFPTDVDISQRVLLPAGPVESHGVEDARFVQFSDEGRSTYLAGYTAYDGHCVVQQVLRTDDFQHFHSTPLLGPAAANKGLAIFPRKIHGRYAALSRLDRESNFVAYTHDLNWWEEAHPLVGRREVWEAIQVGNCGSPIETPAGWLVLTHGVGPMRSYSIGALLLDLDEPQRVIGRLVTPLLSTDPLIRDGYVPNVVYSCGSLVHGDHLVLPHGIADCTIGVATFSVPEVLEALRNEGRAPSPIRAG